MHRLGKAVDANRNYKAIIIVSGGQGPQEDITEALAMERYLKNKGIPQERIIKKNAQQALLRISNIQSKYLINISKNPTT